MPSVRPKKSFESCDGSDNDVKPDDVEANHPVGHEAVAEKATPMLSRILITLVSALLVGAIMGTVMGLVMRHD